MSKAFTKEHDGDDNHDDLDDEDTAPLSVKNYMTPTGFAMLQREWQQLVRVERPKIVETVAWAAGNGDRSENGDYIYGKKRLREIDRRARYLSRQLRSAEVVDPKQQQGLEQVFFGATVTYEHEDGTRHTITLVGIDEADVAAGKVNWASPIAKALLKARVGDQVEIHTPSGNESLEVIEIAYRVMDET